MHFLAFPIFLPSAVGDLTSLGGSSISLAQLIAARAFSSIFSIVFFEMRRWARNRILFFESAYVFFEMRSRHSS